MVIELISVENYDALFSLLLFGVGVGVVVVIVSGCESPSSRLGVLCWWCQVISPESFVMMLGAMTLTLMTD